VYRRLHGGLAGEDQLGRALEEPLGARDLEHLHARVVGQAVVDEREAVALLAEPLEGRGRRGGHVHAITLPLQDRGDHGGVGLVFLAAEEAPRRAPGAALPGRRQRERLIGSPPPARARATGAAALPRAAAPSRR